MLGSVELPGDQFTWDIKVGKEDDWWIKELIPIKILYVQVLWVEQKAIFYQTYQEI